MKNLIFFINIQFIYFYAIFLSFFTINHHNIITYLIKISLFIKTILTINSHYVLKDLSIKMILNE